jgi:hypothetical protein
MLKFVIFGLPCLLVCFSCLPFVSGEYSERTVMSDYAEATLSGHSLAVHVSSNDFTIHNLWDVTRYLGIGIPLERYWSFFIEKFPESIKKQSTFRTVQVSADLDSIELVSRSLALESDALILIDIPRNDQVISIGAELPDFVLFLREFSIFRRSADAGRTVLRPEIPDEPDDVPGNRRPRTTRDPENEQVPESDIWFTGMKFPKIINQCVYVLWDNRSGSIVSYGEISVGAGGSKDSPWEPNLNAMARKIMQKSPFSR